MRKEYHLNIARQHRALDLYNETRRTILELDNITKSLSDRKEKLNIFMSRFEYINSLNEDDVIMTLNSNKPLLTKKQIKAYKKYLKTLTSSNNEI
jgi:malate synthase